MLNSLTEIGVLREHNIPVTSTTFLEFNVFKTFVTSFSF